MVFDDESKRSEIKSDLGMLYSAESLFLPLHTKIKTIFHSISMQFVFIIHLIISYFEPDEKKLHEIIAYYN